MNKKHIGLIIVGILFLAVMTIIGVIQCAHENNQANILWPEGRVLSR